MNTSGLQVGEDKHRQLLCRLHQLPRSHLFHLHKQAREEHLVKWQKMLRLPKNENDRVNGDEAIEEDVNDQKERQDV